MRASKIDQTRVSRSLQHYTSCHLCEHRCGANRAGGERGRCKAGVDARVFRHRVEYGEELELIPSHLFYLSGCDLRCAFCIAGAKAFDPHQGTRLTGDYLREAVDWGKSQGAENIQWVGGEPTIHIPAVLEAMHACQPLPPIVWKSDFYGTPDALELLLGVVDIYVADYKFGNDFCARRIAKVENYTEVVGRNLVLASEQTDLIVRHLLLPGHFDCCFREIVAWMKEHLPGTKFSIRDGYLPRWQANRYAELAERLDWTEGIRAREYADRHGLHVIV